MSEECISVEELERVLELPGEHPRRRHLDECARCRGLADMLGEFAAEAPAPPGSGFADVDARLRASIAGITGIAEASPAAPSRPGPVSWFRLPRWQPAFAFAALLVVGFGGAAIWRANAPAPLMRDGAGAQAQSFAALPERAVAGGLELGWSAAPGADGYAVVFLDGSLREIARLAPLKNTRCRLDAAALPAGLAHGAEVAWQVEAFAGGDWIARTSARALRVP